MHRLILAMIACLAIFATAAGQEPAQATELGPELANLQAFVGKWKLTVEGIDEKGFAEIKSMDRWPADSATGKGPRLCQKLVARGTLQQTAVSWAAIWW
jgi:hypothetical protein